MDIKKTPNGYAIISQTGDSILLSEAEIADLALNARQMLGLSQSDDPSQSQYTPVATEPLEDITVGIDAHHSVVVLTFHLHGGRQIGCTAEEGFVTELRDMLSRKIALIQASSKNVQ